MKAADWWLKAVRKPEYLWQPRRALKRIKTYVSASHGSPTEVVKLPWGYELQVNSTEVIGRGIARMGIHDLAVSEALWRLHDPGDTALDVGANIGYMTALLAVRTGPTGCVHAFEPHPALFTTLKENIARWPCVCVKPHMIAISSITGHGQLEVPRGFTSNQGISRLLPLRTSTTGCDVSPKSIAVSLYRLDEWAGDLNIGVMKVDVEGHELEVFRGSEWLLRQANIRDIIFEDHDPYPSQTTDFIEQCGYTLFKLDKGLWGPTVRPARPRQKHRSFSSPSFLATVDRSRVQLRLRAKGWHCLTP